MKIKANKNLYKNVLITFSSILIFIETLAYFLGFDINSKSLLYYFVFLIPTILMFLALFIIIDKNNKKYIIFDNEKIVERRKADEKIIVYFSQILYTKYHNSIDLFFGIIDFGYVEIVYKVDSKDKDPRYITLYLSKKQYKKNLINKF